MGRNKNGAKAFSSQRPQKVDQCQKSWAGRFERLIVALEFLDRSEKAEKLASNLKKGLREKAVLSYYIYIRLFFADF